MIKYLQKISTKNDAIKDHTDTLLSTKTAGEMVDKCLMLISLMLDLIKLVSSQKYMEHVYKNCQKEIVASNIAIAKKNLTILSMITKNVKKNT